MTSYSLEFIRSALGRRLSRTTGTLPQHVSGVSIDTRTIKPGDLFIALAGDRFDGHHFVDEALNKGASAAIVNNFYEGAPSTKGALIFVDDTLKAFHDLARAHLKQMPAKRIALSGSNGKTTTKELIRCALSAALGESAVFASSGNQNNHFGVPLSAFKVTSEHQAAIFEMGMNHFGELAVLADIVRPHVGLITNMGTAHSGNLGGPDGVAKAKSELFEALGENDIGIVNVDDPRCMREADAKVKGKKITFGRAQWADVRIIEIKSTWDNPNQSKSDEALGMHLTLAFKDKEQTAWLPLLGNHNAQNAAGAVATALALGVDFATAVKGLSSMHAVKGRLQKHVLKNGAIVLDDTYNANPDSMEAGLTVLSSWQDRRHIAILGAMVELGSGSFSLHRAIGAACAQKHVDRIFACGDNAKAYGEGAIEAGISPENFVWAPNSEALAELVAPQIGSNDVVLIKGSRLTQMEIVVQRLLLA